MRRIVAVGIVSAFDHVVDWFRLGASGIRETIEIQAQCICREDMKLNCLWQLLNKC